jgi:hypothetical protein
LKGSRALAHSADLVLIQDRRRLAAPRVIGDVIAVLEHYDGALPL